MSACIIPMSCTRSCLPPFARPRIGSSSSPPACIYLHVHDLRVCGIRTHMVDVTPHSSSPGAVKSKYVTPGPPASQTPAREQKKLLVKHGTVRTKPASRPLSPSAGGPLADFDIKSATPGEIFDYCVAAIKQKILTFVDYELGANMGIAETVTYADITDDDGNPISCIVEHESLAKPEGVSASLINPHVPWKSQWDVLIIILVIVNAVMIPLTIAFPDETVEDPGVTLTMDVLFMVDLGINFRTAIILENGLLEWDVREIRQTYLRGWFPIDLVACIPLDFCLQLVFLISGGDPDGSGTNSGSDAAKVKLLLRLLKLPRLLRMGRIFKYLERSAAAALWRITRLLIGYVMVGHWLGCIFIFICQAEANEGMQTFFTPNADDSFGDVYVHALRTAMLMMIGEGIDVATEIEEWFATAMLVIGNVLSAVIIGNISIVLANRNVKQSQYNTKIDTVAVTMRTMKIPPTLQQKALDYYDFMWQRHRRFDAHSDFTQDLSEDIRSRIQLQLNQDTVAQNPIFQKCTRAAVVALLQRLETQIYLGGDVLIREGDVGMEMFFLVKGKAGVVLKSGLQVATYTDGAYFGELSLIKDAPRSAHVFAKTHCDVRILHKDSFSWVCENYPEVREKFVIHLKNKYTKPDTYDISVKVCGANVMRADFFGKSDAYCVVRFNGIKVGSTKIIRKSLTPQWDETFDFKFQDTDFFAQTKFSFELYDWDEYGSHDFLGQATLEGPNVKLLGSNMAARVPLERPLTNKKGSKKMKGNITLKTVRWKKGSSHRRSSSFGIGSSPGSSPQGGKLGLKGILRGKALGLAALTQDNIFESDKKEVDIIESESDEEANEKEAETMAELNKFANAGKVSTESRLENMETKLGTIFTKLEYISNRLDGQNANDSPVGPGISLPPIRRDVPEKLIFAD